MSFKEDVISFIAVKLNVDRGRIQESTYFMADLGLSSLRSVELLCDFEDHFGLRIEDKDFQSIRQVGDVIALLEARAGRNERGEERCGMRP